MCSIHAFWEQNQNVFIVFETFPQINTLPTYQLRLQATVLQSHLFCFRADYQVVLVFGLDVCLIMAVSCFHPIDLSLTIDIFHFFVYDVHKSNSQEHSINFYIAYLFLWRSIEV